jgi:hypothetical protein
MEIVYYETIPDLDTSRRNSMGENIITLEPFSMANLEDYFKEFNV